MAHDATPEEQARIEAISKALGGLDAIDASAILTGLLIEIGQRGGWPVANVGAAMIDCCADIAGVPFFDMLRAVTALAIETKAAEGDERAIALRSQAKAAKQVLGGSTRRTVHVGRRFRRG